MRILLLWELKDECDGEKGGKASAARTPEQRSASAKKAAATRKRNAEQAE